MIKEQDALFVWLLVCVLLTMGGYFLISTQQVYEGTNIKFNFTIEEMFSVSDTATFDAIAERPFILLGTSGQVVESRYSRQLQSNGADSHIVEKTTVLSDTFEVYDGVRILGQTIYAQVKAESPVKVVVYDDPITWGLKYIGFFVLMIVVAFIGYKLISHFSQTWFVNSHPE